MTPDTEEPMAFTPLNNLFKSRAASAVDTVSGKLEAARQHHAELLARRTEAAYAEAMEEDGAADRLAQLMAEISAAEQKIDLLTLAMDEANRREQERLREARIAADKSRVRALKQHLASLEKAAGNYERAISEAAQAWNSVLGASRRAGKLLLNGPDGPAADLISPQKLREYAQQALDRLAFPTHPGVTPNPMPGARASVYWNGDEKPAPMAETLRSHAEWILGQTEVAGERLAGTVPQGKAEPVPDAAA